MIKVGNLIKASYMGGSSTHTGIVTCIEKKERLFSDKYNITETEHMVHVLCDGTIKIFSLEEDNIEVINETKENV
tara:strand:- start:3066 stop:3290 length:225 start_codon:yes stop_codon:yes gene_type:complete